MKRINPIYLLIALNVLLIFFRDVLLTDEASAAIGAAIETYLAGIGAWAYVGIAAAYVVCSFFFVPLLIPLNILGGALYGAAAGTVLAIVGITLGCIASTLSVRYVFTGMQRSIDERPAVRRLLARADTHSNLVIVMVRLAVIVPYLVQNLALAATGAPIWRLALMTSVSAIPGAAIYSLLGAGLVQADDVGELSLYVGLPVALLLALAGALAFFNGRQRKAASEGHSQEASS